MLQRAEDGDVEARDALYGAVYEELKRIAHYHFRGESPGHTLQPTALVNEAFVRLFGKTPVHLANRAHFFAVASQTIRRILVDHARGKRRLKRGGGRPIRSLQPFDGGDAASRTTMGPAEILDISEGLDKLARLHPRQSKALEMKFFGGLRTQEIADYLGTSTRTVENECKMAKLWMMQYLEKGWKS